MMHLADVVCGVILESLWRFIRGHPVAKVGIKVLRGSIVKMVKGLGPARKIPLAHTMCTLKDLKKEKAVKKLVSEGIIVGSTNVIHIAHNNELIRNEELPLKDFVVKEVCI